jgi:NADH:ubiquinone oxidoreductase subunit 5 (subunit L)/multisubunit Na+/H+ antiporter MnhA subunit
MTHIYASLCSYLVINFWFTRLQANKVAIKVMVLNYIGCFGQVLAIRVLLAGAEKYVFLNLVTTKAFHIV